MVHTIDIYLDVTGIHLCLLICFINITTLVTVHTHTCMHVHIHGKHLDLHKSVYSKPLEFFHVMYFLKFRS